MRDRRRPIAGWDPYGSMPDPPDDGQGRFAGWWRRGRFWLVGLVSLLAFAHEIYRPLEWLFARPEARQLAAPAPKLDRIPDPRAELPRGPAPIGMMTDWYTSDDYPADALRAGVEGIVAIHFTIGVDGRISRCDIVASSGSPQLDKTSCGVLMRRALYWPARNADGQPVPSDGRRKVRWQIPKE